jgi:hypothetical protein
MYKMVEENAHKTQKNYTFKRVPVNPLIGVNLKVEQGEISPISHYNKFILRAFTV